jgi:hypothetical protein
MFWSDHAPPHFHAFYAEYEALIDIQTLRRYAAASLAVPKSLCLNGLPNIALNCWRIGIDVVKTCPQRKLRRWNDAAHHPVQSMVRLRGGGPRRVKAVG